MEAQKKKLRRDIMAVCKGAGKAISKARVGAKVGTAEDAVLESLNYLMRKEKLENVIVFARIRGKDYSNIRLSKLRRAIMNVLPTNGGLARKDIKPLLKRDILGTGTLGQTLLSMLEAKLITFKRGYVRIFKKKIPGIDKEFTAVLEASRKTYLEQRGKAGVLKLPHEGLDKSHDFFKFKKEK